MHPPLVLQSVYHLHYSKRLRERERSLTSKFEESGMLSTELSSISSIMQDKVEDQVALVSQLYPVLYPQLAPQQGEPKRRRRRKNKSEGSGSGAKKRKLSEEQMNMLEISFGCEHKLESERKDRLASELGLDPRQVAVWFQNRRARWKNKQLEEEYSKLRNQHESLVVDKCHLETEVLNLKDQLSNAKKEIQRLLERPSSSSVDNVSSNSPSSSLTIDHYANAIDHQLLREQFGVEGCINGMFSVLGSEYIPSMEWVNLYDV